MADFSGNEDKSGTGNDETSTSKDKCKENETEELEEGAEGKTPAALHNRGEPKEGDRDDGDGLKKTVEKGLRAGKKLVKSCVGAQAEDSESETKDSKSKTKDSKRKPENRPDSDVPSKHHDHPNPVRDDREVYNFSHPKRGRAIIINNEKFPGWTGFNDRPGSENDASCLNKMFKKLGFDVKLYENLPADKIKRALVKAAEKYDHENADCLAVAILSHGDSVLRKKAFEANRREKTDLIYGVDGKYVETASVIRTFQDGRCKGLAGKPRLFFLQACRGGEFDDGMDILVTKSSDKRDGGDEEDRGGDKKDEGDDASDAKPESGSGDAEETDAHAGSRTQDKFVASPSPLFKDFLVMYATTPGHFAWRRTNGSWFVQSLNSVFTHDLLPSMSLTQALTRVTRMVAHGYQAKGDLPGKKQTPVIESMLTKDIYFDEKKKK